MSTVLVQVFNEVDLVTMLEVVRSVFCSREIRCSQEAADTEIRLQSTKSIS